MYGKVHPCGPCKPSFFIKLCMRSAATPQDLGSMICTDEQCVGHLSKSLVSCSIAVQAAPKDGTPF